VEAGALGNVDRCEQGQGASGRVLLSQGWISTHRKHDGEDGEASGGARMGREFGQMEQ
jgi:hypothetical protein